MKYVMLCALLFVTTLSWAETNDETAINKVLNQLHAHASAANFNAYFALYATEATFIGTDADEVWSIEDFKAYAKPHFDKGRGWTYHPRDRHIYLSANRRVAWFDELLDNNNLGETRGTGVLIREKGQWKVAQYHLAIPIPNALADEITRKIKRYKP